MLDRLTDRARRALTFANQEAQRLAHDHVGTEHLLLGMVKENSGLAAIVLHEFHIDLSTVRQEVLRVTHGPSQNPPAQQLPQTPRLQRVLRQAIEEAESLSHNYVGTEHLLLGLLREPDGTAARALANLKLNADDVRASVLNLLGKAPKAKDSLLDQAMKDLTLHLADESIDPRHIRSTAEALINAGWRPRD
jgi:ATP-dependent Clp protease ATP-binding subunit ClpC